MFRFDVFPHYRFVFVVNVRCFTYTALNRKLKDKDILVLDFDMLDYSVHQSMFEKTVKHFGKVSVRKLSASKSY